jgi:hypothetical protein
MGTVHNGGEVVIVENLFCSQLLENGNVEGERRMRNGRDIMSLHSSLRRRNGVTAIRSATFCPSQRVKFQTDALPPGSGLLWLWRWANSLWRRRIRIGGALADLVPTELVAK